MSEMTLTEAPEIIWANAHEYPKGTGRIEVYASAQPDPEAPATQYVRADLHDALRADLAKAVEALDMLDNLSARDAAIVVATLASIKERE